MANWKISKRSQVYARAGSRGTFDIFRDLGLRDVSIIGLLFIIRGNQVSTAGGAISGFHRDAPSGVITNLNVHGSHRVGNRRDRTVVNMPMQQLYWIGHKETGWQHSVLTTSAGASATDPFRATVALPFADRHSRLKGRVYIDGRDYDSLNADVNWITDADYATTNLSDLSSEELEVIATVVEDGPAKGEAHYEPNLVYKELPMDATGAKITENQEIVWDGLLMALAFQQHDDSATGDSERTNGILRRVTAIQNGRALIDDARWENVLRDGYTLYPYGGSVTETVGHAIVPINPHAKSRDGVANIRRNTTETVPLGITAVTAAASDRLYVTALAAEAVHGAAIQD